MSPRIPIVSIGMPVYNSSQWIAKTLDSIMNQTFADFELVISDNASTDNTPEVIQEYASQDSRIKYYRNKENIGVSNNYNNAFLKSSGKYFKWSSASDLCKPEFLKLCVEVLDSRADAVLAYPKTILFDPDTGKEERYVDGLDLQEDNAADRFRGYLAKVRLNNVMNGLIRSSELRKTGLYKKYLAADVNLLAELTLYGKFIEIPEYLFMRRMDSATATAMQTKDEVKAYYDPGKKSKMLFNNFHMMYQYFVAVFRSDITMDQKMKLYLLLLRKINWEKHRLAADIKEALK